VPRCRERATALPQSRRQQVDPGRFGRRSANMRATSPSLHPGAPSPSLRRHQDRRVGAPTARHQDVLLAVDGVADDAATHSGAGVEAPEHLAGIRVERLQLAHRVAVEDQAQSKRAGRFLDQPVARPTLGMGVIWEQCVSGDGVAPLLVGRQRRCNSSGSLVILMAIRRASSRVSRFAALRVGSPHSHPPSSYRSDVTPACCTSRTTTHAGKWPPFIASPNRSRVRGGRLHSGGGLHSGGRRLRGYANNCPTMTIPHTSAAKAYAIYAWLAGNITANGQKTAISAAGGVVSLASILELF